MVDSARKVAAMSTAEVPASALTPNRSMRRPANGRTMAVIGSAANAMTTAVFDQWNSISNARKNMLEMGVYSPTPQARPMVAPQRSDQPDFSSSLNVEIGKKLIEERRKGERPLQHGIVAAFGEYPQARVRQAGDPRGLDRIRCDASVLGTYRYQCLVR